MLALGGCAAGYDEFQQYTEEQQVYVDANDTWRIVDKPTEGRLLIRATFGRAVANTPIFGGIAEIPKSEFQGAIEAWFRSSDRTCVVLDGYPLFSANWEFKYRCD